MHPYRRALSAVATASLISTGLVAGSATSVHAAPTTQAPAALPGLSDLLELPALPSPSTPPELTGIPGIGQVLEVTKPLFAALPLDLQALLSFDVSWLCNGELIDLPPQADPWTYVPTEAQAGCAMAAQVTTTLLGFLPLDLVTSSLQMPGAAATAPTATSPVSIPAQAKVGQQLTATAPTWDTTDVVTTYQWFRSGVAIPGATGVSHTVVPEDAMRALTVRATGTRGDQTGTSTSNPVTPALGDAPTPVSRPALRGAPKVGGLLSVDPGTWSGTGTATYAYQWMRGNTPVAGETGSTYVLTGADAGQDVWAAVTATRAGYQPGRATTEPVQVGRSATTTKIALVKKKVTRGSRGILTIRLKAAGLTPAGTVKVLDRGKPVKKYVVRAADNGVRRVKLPKLAPGKHRLRAVYAGSQATAGSRSSVVTLTVLKRR